MLRFGLSAGLLALVSAQVLSEPPRHPTRVRGVVVDDRGQPVAGAYVECGDAQNTVHPFRGGVHTRTDARGHFSCGPVGAGTIALRVADAREAYVVFEFVGSSRDVRRVTLVRRAIVRGTVSFGDGGVSSVQADPLDAAGQPADGPDDTVDAIPNSTLAPVDGGRFDLRLDPSAKQLRLHGDFVERTLPLELAPGRVLDLGEIHVERAGSIEGSVPRNVGPFGPWVCAAAVAQPPQPEQAKHCVRAATDGGFTIGSLPPGRYVVTEQPQSADGGREVDVEVGTPARVELEGR